MSLNSRALALQGFLLTPIAMAVQGLIAVLALEDEKQSQVYGRGRQKSAPRSKPQDELTREEVEAQWDLLETRLRAQVKDPAVDGAVAALPDPVEVAPTVVGVPSVGVPSVGVPSVGVPSGGEIANSAIQQRRQEEEIMLMLCL